MTSVRLRALTRLGYVVGIAWGVAVPTPSLGQEIDINDTQVQYNRGMNVAPIYEGWTKNPDGTIDFWFGYLNQNFEEVLHIAIGPDNRIEPLGPDAGQPTVFVPRRRTGRAVQRRETMVFSVTVPATWTRDDELVWTINAHGRTDRAIGLYLPIYELTGPRGSNTPPSLEVSIKSESIALSDTAMLFAKLSDAAQDRRRRSANIRWVHYRGIGTVSFSPSQTPFPEGQDAIANLESTTTARFNQPGRFMLRAVAYDGDLYVAENVIVEVSEN